MLNLIRELIDGSRYVASLSCLTNDPTITSLYVISDILLAVSMIAFGTRIFMLRHIGYYLFPYQCKMVALITVLIAVGSVFDVVTIFQAVYRVEVILRGATAGIASVLAVTCWMNHDSRRRR